MFSTLCIWFFGVPTWSGDIDIAPEHVRSDMVPCREED